jgi:ketosteroid isomerase-like protein
LADIEDAAPDFRIELDDIKAVDHECVVVFVRTRSTGRSSGIPLGAASTNVYDTIDGKISRIRIFLDRREALEAVGIAE